MLQPPWSLFTLIFVARLILLQNCPSWFLQWCSLIYFISFINDFIHFTWPYLLKEWSQGWYAFKIFFAKVEFLCTILKLLVLCNNQGGKYVSRNFLVFCIQASITHELAQVHTSSHNGVSKCKNCTLLEKVHSMVVNAHIPRFL